MSTGVNSMIVLNCFCFSSVDRVLLGLMTYPFFSKGHGEGVGRLQTAMRLLEFFH